MPYPNDKDVKRSEKDNQKDQDKGPFKGIALLECVPNAENGLASHEIQKKLNLSSIKLEIEDYEFSGPAAESNLLVCSSSSDG